MDPFRNVLPADVREASTANQGDAVSAPHRHVLDRAIVDYLANPPFDQLGDPTVAHLPHAVTVGRVQDQRHIASISVPTRLLVAENSAQSSSGARAGLQPSGAEVASWLSPIPQTSRGIRDNERGTSRAGKLDWCSERESRAAAGAPARKSGAGRCPSTTSFREGVFDVEVVGTEHNLDGKGRTIWTGRYPHNRRCSEIAH